MKHLLVQREDSSPTVLPFAGGQVAVFSARSPDKTTPNEDAACLVETPKLGAMMAVADGCGGMPNGDEASRIAVESLSRCVAALGDDGPSLRSALLDGIEKANRQVKDLGTGAASTLVAVEVAGEVIRTYHVGDSQVLLVGGRGKVKLLTRPHSPVGYAVEAGVISESEAHHHEERHVVSNVLGTFDTHIEIGPTRKLAQRDTLLLASDGLFDNLRTEEIVEIIRKGPLEKCASDLIDLTTRRMHGEAGELTKPDDLTFILFRPVGG